MSHGLLNEIPGNPMDSETCSNGRANFPKPPYEIGMHSSISLVVVVLCISLRVTLRRVLFFSLPKLPKS